MNKIVKRTIFTIALTTFALFSILLYNKIDNTVEFAVIMGALLFVLAVIYSIVRVINKIVDNHFAPMVEVQRIKNKRAKLFPDEFVGCCAMRKNNLVPPTYDSMGMTLHDTFFVDNINHSMDD